MGFNEHLPFEYRQQLTPDIMQDFQDAEVYTKEVSEKYYRAISFLPSEYRLPLFSLYAVLRSLDNLVDEQTEKQHDLIAQELQKEIEEFHTDVHAGFSERKYYKSVIFTKKALGIPTQYFDTYFDALRQDITTDEYQSYDQLSRYSYATSGITGVMMSHVFGVTDPACIEASARLGEAFAITNFLDDMQQDWDRRQKIYIPREDYERFGISRDDFSRGFDPAELKRLWKFEKQRALDIYADGQQVLKYLPPLPKIIIRAVINRYKKLLNEPNARLRPQFPAEEFGKETENQPRPLLTMVIPTKNEAGNIQRLLDALHENLDLDSTSILFVDDSDDNTAEAIRSYNSKIPIEIIERAKDDREGGLATAVALGMQRAKGKYICIMDADLQHPPDKIPLMIKEASENHNDIVIASRYVDGSMFDDNLPGYRHFLSRFSVKAMWLLLPETKSVHDPGSGFFLINRRILENATLNATGYKILMELLVKTQWGKVAEIPYTFGKRTSGESKATAGVGLEFLYHLYLLYQYRKNI